MPDELDDLKAALADKYAIERELGRGGMATVYLAVDLKHKRKVAVKVLRPDLAAILGAERFLREIEVTANLQHPNILPLYDSGQAGKSLYYVMPFVEGESLRDKLDREKQLPVEETVEIAKAIAAALQYAHERNIVHRDIKPENILLQSGQALVADFGIALAVSQAGDGRMTETGVALGTPHYMSPEQATGGRDLDARSDIYSLGAITYEMLTGDPPHPGSTVQAIVAKIVTEMPSPIAQTRSMVPENIDAAVQVALAKAPADRFTSAERFAQALADPGFVLPTTGAHRHPSGRNSLARIAWPATSLALLVALLAVLLQSPDPPRAPVVRAALSLGPGQELRSYSGPGIARDGSFFVYPGSADAGNLLWVRRLDETEARAIPGSEGGRSPRVSPDGQRVSFEVWNGNDWILKVASLIDGSVRTLTDTLGADVADWGPDDHLYFQGQGGLWRISANGGQPELAAPADSALGERGFGRPHVLPNGRGILMTSGNLKVFDLETKTIKRFEVRGGYWQYIDGYIVYRNAVQGEQRLFAIPFDAERLEITGEARQLSFTPRMGGFGSADFAVSPSGALVYVSTERGRTDMVWVSRDGTERSVDPDWDGAMRRARISPDGTMMVGETRGADGRAVIATKALDGGPLRPITFDLRNPFGPTWHPDGTQVTFVDSDRGQLVASLDGRTPTSIGGDLNVTQAIWSPNGQWLVLRVGPADLYIQHTHPDSVPRPLITSQGSVRAPAISPNGRYLAYVSNVAGQGDIIVQPFPNVDDGRVQVSFNGGYSPVWPSDGRELFYRDGFGRMFAAQVSTTGTFRVDSVEPLFSGSAYEFSTTSRRYDVHPDGERFLMVRRRGDELILVHNWIEELRAFMGGP